MDMYRITRVDEKPGGFYGRRAGTPEVRYGTKRRASAVARQVREDNAARRWGHEKYPHIPLQLITLTVERAPVEGWEDVTAEFLKGDE